MRTEQPMRGFDPEKNELFRLADYRDAPDDVLMQVDELLVGYGLEVVLIDMRSDEYVFRIGRRLSEDLTR